LAIKLDAATGKMFFGISDCPSGCGNGFRFSTNYPPKAEPEIRTETRKTFATVGRRDPRKKARRELIGEKRYSKQPVHEGSPVPPIKAIRLRAASEEPVASQSLAICG